MLPAMFIICAQLNWIHSFTFILLQSNQFCRTDIDVDLPAVLFLGDLWLSAVHSFYQSVRPCLYQVYPFVLFLPPCFHCRGKNAWLLTKPWYGGTVVATKDVVLSLSQCKEHAKHSLMAHNLSKF